MSKQTPRRGYQHENHPRPVTRRQFLGQGLIAGAATLASPGLFGLLRPGTAAAQAASCGIAARGGMIPFLCFDLGGGASVAGSNVLVGADGQLDALTVAGYSRLGLPNDMLPTDPAQVNTELGLAFHADSAFLRGIVARTSPETRAKVNGAVICARSDNDTGNNPHNPMYGINKAGAKGELVTLVGTRSSESGGRSMAPAGMIDPAVRPVKVERPEEATGLVDTGKLVDLLGADSGHVMRAMEQISERKLDKINEDDLVEQLIRCAYVQSTHLVENFGDPDDLDPRLDEHFVTGASPILSLGDFNQSEFRKTSAVSKLVIDGMAGAGTIEFGGYDYHNGTRATGEIKDFRAGEAMGVALEYAARRSRPLMLYVFSDGSVAADGVVDPDPAGRGKFVWRGDNSGTAACFFLVFDPNATVERPLLVDATRQQIGYFRTNGSNETSATRVSNNVVALAESIVLNYLALHDGLGTFATALPGHGLGTVTERETLVAFQPIATMPPVI
jgi:hypothetical protein